MTLRRTMLAGAAGAAVFCAPAAPASAVAPLTEGDAAKDVVKLVRAHGEATNRGVRLYRANAKLRGVKPDRRRRVKLSDWTVGHVRRHNVALRKRNSKLRREAAAQQAAATTTTGGSAATPGHLQSIAACESGGDPGAVSADGTYRGKYQFDAQTWAAMGGSGDPAAAPEAEQDARAAKLYEQSGSSPWPVCG